MAFKIGDATSSKKAGHSQFKINFNVNPESARLKNSLNGSSSSQDSAVVDNISHQSRDLLTLSTAKSTLEQKASALDEISRLREEQRTLAKTVKDGPDTRGNFDAIQSELSSIQSRIDEIAATKDANGNPILSAVELSSGFDENKNSLVVADTSSLAADLNLDVSSPTAAKSAVDTLDDNILSLNTAKTSNQSALEETDNLLSATVAESKADQTTDRPKSVEEAQKLARDVAGEIQSQFKTEDPNLQVVLNTLDPQRVNSLLKE